MEKTLAERAEEARIAYKKENDAWWQNLRDSEAQLAVEYFKRTFPEVKYIGNGKFELEGQVYSWSERWDKSYGSLYYSQSVENKYELYSFENFFKFSNLAEYGECLRNKKAKDEFQRELKEERRIYEENCQWKIACFIVGFLILLIIMIAALKS
jgi:hypothetical protein